MIRPVDSDEPELTSTANPRVKAVVRLRDRRERERTGQTLIDGARELRRALKAGVTIEDVFVCTPLLRGADARAVLDGLAEAGVPLRHTTETVFAKLAFGERAEGLLAVASVPSTTLEELALPADPLIVVLEGVEKPGNLGAVLRSADGAGADALVAASPRTDLFNPNVIRASAGTVFGVPLAAASSDEVLAWLIEHGIRIVAARVDATVAYTDIDLSGPLAITLGSEADGLTDAWRGATVEAVRLPMLGVADSLNVSVTAAVLLYEARRQRGSIAPSV
jgi:TrmH family RNA methyltransferase